VPTLKNVIGQALPKIGAYKRLDSKQQVVALINDVSLVCC
jgi:dihydropyrimidine dehydrogenase (NADP+)